MVRSPRDNAARSTPGDRGDRHCRRCPPRLRPRGPSPRHRDPRRNRRRSARANAEREKHTLAQQRLIALQAMNSAAAKAKRLEADAAAYRVLTQATAQADAIRLVTEQRGRSAGTVCRRKTVLGEVVGALRSMPAQPGPCGDEEGRTAPDGIGQRAESGGVQRRNARGHSTLRCRHRASDRRRDSRTRCTRRGSRARGCGRVVRRRCCAHARGSTARAGIRQ